MEPQKVYVNWQTAPDIWKLIKPLARQMRHEPTPAEKMLWQSIRNRKVNGVKFRRQFPIDRFIADFAAPAKRLVLEVDGSIHDYTPEQDAIRQAFIESLGFRVLRIPNEEVFANLEAVLVKISDALSAHSPLD